MNAGHSALTVGSLFSGIGGIDLGLERTGGFRTAWFSEVDPFASAVLARHWPDVPNLGDIHNIRTLTPALRVDVLAGGFPCQPVSLAGKREGQDDARWLWPEFARLVGLLRPRVVLVENVPGLASKGLRDVVTDLATLGYDAEWDIVSAAALGAPHLRERLFIIAHPERLELREQPGRCRGSCREGAALPGFDGEARPMAGAGTDPHCHCHGREGQSQHDGQPVARCEARPLGDDAHGLRGAMADADGPAGQPEGGAGVALRRRVWKEDTSLESGRRRSGLGEHWALEPDVGRVAHGVPDRAHRLRALGNGVVPQVAEFVGRLILEAVQESLL